MSRNSNPRDILVRPVISEKSYRLADDGKYTFIVAPGSNKTQIRQAVEASAAMLMIGCAWGGVSMTTRSAPLSFMSAI